MPPNLPPVLPTRPTEPTLHGAPSVSLHDQDLAVLKLQQTEDRENARRGISHSVGDSGFTRVLSSVSHIGASNRPSASISRVGRQDDNLIDEAADDRRYEYARKMIRERQVKEKKAEAITKKDDTFKVGIGKGYRTTGRESFDRRLSRLIRAKRATYKNISKEDKKVFTGIVKTTLKGKPVGSEVTRLNRLKMKLKIERERASRGGTFSSEDVKDFKGLVEKLK
ncbi:MAG: hypothetical protein AAB390_00650 [Patescibacteria group bacterium]